MQPNDAGVVLEDAACEVLETMFFAAPLEEPPQDDEPAPRICASVEFRGGRAGCFTACLAEPAARELAEVFLGCETEPGVEAVTEVAGELANMVCGSVLGRLEPQTLFELAPPRASRCPGHPGAPARILPLSGGTLRLYLETGETLPPAPGS